MVKAETGIWQVLYNDKTNGGAWKSKTLFLILVFVSLLLNAGTADGKLSVDKKGLSCKTLRAMSRVYMAYGEYAKAQPFAEQALASARRKDVSDSELAWCLIDLAYLYNEQGKLENAEKMCVLGLELQEKLYYKKHPYIAYTLMTLSSIHQGQGRYDQAETALDKAMNIMLESHTADSKAMIPFQVNFAKLLTAQGQFEKADAYYQSAMVLINDGYGPDHLYTAIVCGSIARLYTIQGKYTKAEELIDRAVATQEKYYGPDHHLIAASWLTKAEVCRVKGNCTESNRLIEKALSAVKKSGNMTILAKMKQRAEKIRSVEPAVSASIAKAL